MSVLYQTPPEIRPKYVIAYPFGGRPLALDWHIAVWNLQLPTNSSSVEIFRRSVKLEDAQTQMCEQALELGAEYIFFIEDDTEPPRGAIVELTRVLEQSPADVMACGGIYGTRTDPSEPVVYMGPGQGSYWRWKLGEVFPCWSIGFGCTMLKMKVFELMPKPWFKNLDTLDEIREYPDLFPEIIAKAPKKCGVTTDIFFFTKLAKIGLKVMAHGGIRPKHWDMQRNEPCEPIYEA
jgi:hypothetical protein